MDPLKAFRKKEQDTRQPTTTAFPPDVLSNHHVELNKKIHIPVTDPFSRPNEMNQDHQLAQLVEFVSSNKQPMRQYIHAIQLNDPNLIAVSSKALSVNDFWPMFINMFSGQPDSILDIINNVVGLEHPMQNYIPAPAEIEQAVTDTFHELPPEQKAHPAVLQEIAEEMQQNILNAHKELESAAQALHKFCEVAGLNG